MNYLAVSTEHEIKNIVKDRAEDYSLPEFNSSSTTAFENNVHSLAKLWAQKYVGTLAAYDDLEAARRAECFQELTSPQGRAYTASQLLKHLNFMSAIAWSLTESLLTEEIPRHGIDITAIDPWQISADCHALYNKTLNAYAEGVSPQRLAVVVGKDFGRVRQKYTSEEPRLIGFVSMQFHYTGIKLLERLSLPERALVSPYLKVMDDHMYMPLRSAYEAAAKHAPDSPALAAVQHLLPLSTKLAHQVCSQVRKMHNGYETMSGSLADAVVKTSSIRDVEMFQVYLCLCTLENDLRAVKRELFPLCVMLYPRLKVKWELVQDMLKTLAWEMHDCLDPGDMSIFLPHLCALNDMFSVDLSV